MRQSLTISFKKALISTLTGLALAFVTNVIVMPIVFGHVPTVGENASYTAIFTLISLARGFALERVFESLGWRIRLTPFETAVIAERRRHQAVEGWDAAHDEKHHPRELGYAAAAYMVGTKPLVTEDCLGRSLVISGRMIWPWTLEFWKPEQPIETDLPHRRDFVRGVALGIAAGDRLDQALRRRWPWQRPDQSRDLQLAPTSPRPSSPAGADLPQPVELASADRVA